MRQNRAFKLSFEDLYLFAEAILICTVLESLDRIHSEITYYANRGDSKCDREITTHCLGSILPSFVSTVLEAPRKAMDHAFYCPHAPYYADVFIPKLTLSSPSRNSLQCESVK
jgi:hypothetical protein